MTVQQAEPLTADQVKALREIYYRFNRASTWPTFQDISRKLRQRGMTTANSVIRSIPEHLLARPRAGTIPLQPADELRLTLHGIVEAGGPEDVELFLHVIRVFATAELKFTGEGSPTITSAMLASQIEFDDEYQVARLWQILQREHFGALGSSESEGAWSVTIGPDIARFQNIQSISDYLAARKAWEEEGQVALPSPDEFAWAFEIPSGAVPANTSLYVNEGVTASIKAKESRSKWDCTKLLGLINELNYNYALGHGYAVLALLRAIVDHVPPIFGENTFRAVANNYSWGKTDKQHMKKLLDYTPLGDDALHRQISSDVDVLSIADAPPRQWINRLLQECAKQL